MSKKIIIKSYHKLTVYYASVFLILSLINLLSYFSIISLGVNFIVLILTIIFNYSCIDIDLSKNDKWKLKYRLIVCATIVIFVNTLWYLDFFIQFLKNGISS